jgi:hypothetical protein
MILVGKRLAAQTAHYGHRVDFYLADHQDGKLLHARKIDFQPIAEGAYAEPSFSLQLEVAQELFEQLWSQGFRSKHDKGNAEALDAARREHIGDLRKAAKLA